MMNSKRELLKLQESLLSSAGGAQAVRASLLPFDAAGQCWAIPCDDIARVMMPVDVIRLTGYAQLPTCVIGAVAGEAEMLSVVDAGLLLGREQVHASLKTRLIVFGAGPLKGVAVLVDRVHSRVEAPEGATFEGANLLDAAELNNRLQAKSPNRSQAS